MSIFSDQSKVVIFLHSDIAPGMEDCDCGSRDWVVQLPIGWRWSDSAGLGPYPTLAEAMDVAVALRPDQSTVKRTDPRVPDRWILSPTYDSTSPLPSWLRVPVPLV